MPYKVMMVQRDPKLIMLPQAVVDKTIKVNENKVLRYFGSNLLLLLLSSSTTLSLQGRRLL